jgi:signal peptidase I
MRGKSIFTTTLAAALGAVLLLPFRPTVVMGHSMAPTMRSGSLYMLNTRYYRNHAIRRGDVIVFRYDGETCTKRVFALPGEQVTVLHDPIDHYDELLDADEVEPIRRLESRNRLQGRRVKERTVPPGYLFVLGDNRTVSWDSRAFGFLPMEAIVGRVEM